MKNTLKNNFVYPHTNLLSPTGKFNAKALKQISYHSSHYISKSYLFNSPLKQGIHVASIASKKKNLELFLGNHFSTFCFV